MLKDLRKRTNGRRFPRARLFWVRPGRRNEWWDNFIAQRVTAEEWKENFRMSRETFLKLCDDLRPSLEGRATGMRMPLPVEKQVAVTLYYLADEEPNASVQPLVRVNDLFQFWAVSVHTMPKCFSCRHEKRFGIV